MKEAAAVEVKIFLFLLWSIYPLSKAVNSKAKHRPMQIPYNTRHTITVAMHYLYKTHTSSIYSSSSNEYTSICLRIV